MGERDKTNREERRRNGHLTHSHDPCLVCWTSDKRNGAHKKGAKRRGGEGTLSGGESCTESFPLPPPSFPLIRNGGISFFLFISLARDST